MFALLLLGSKTVVGLDQPSHVFPHSNTYLQPGLQYPFRVQSNVRNSLVYLYFYTKNVSTGVKVLHQISSVFASNPSSHYQVLYTIPACPSGSVFSWEIANFKNGSLSTFSIQESPTTGIQINSGTQSGTEIQCSNNAWNGIKPKTVNYSIDQPSLITFGIYNGLTTWYHATNPSFTVAQTNGGIAFNPSITSNPNQTGTFQFQVPALCVQNVRGSAVFLRIPPIAQNLPLFNGFLIDPIDVVCPDFIECRLKDVTYYELPTLLTLNTSLPGVSISSVDWFYQNPDGTETLNGKTTTGGSFTYLGNTYLRRKVCYSHLIGDDGIPKVNNYRGQITYSTTYIDPISGEAESVNCTASIMATVTPVSSPISLNEAGQGALAAFNNVVSNLDNILPPGIDPCDILGGLGGLPVLGLVTNDGEVQVLEHCRLPNRIDEGYYNPSELQGLGIDPESVTYGWYKEVNRLANQDILISIQELGQGVYIRMMEIDGLPTKEIQQVVVLECVEPITFPEEASLIAKQKEELDALGYELIAVPSEEQVNSFEVQHLLIPVEKSMASILKMEAELNPAFQMTVYPNPAQDQFTIRLEGESKSEVQSITIKDASGRLIDTIVPTELELQNGIISYKNNLTRGMYFIETINGSIALQQRIIIQ